MEVEIERSPSWAADTDTTPQHAFRERLAINSNFLLRDWDMLILSRQRRQQLTNW
jgi:hypothetical protein